MMTVSAVRNWLGGYFLAITASLGAYIIIFQETAALPISGKDATSAFQIIIPTFVGQLTLVFRWFAHPPAGQKTRLNLPHWIVVGPPIAIVLIMAAAITLLLIDQGSSIDGGRIFKNAVTFCVTLLTSTTVFIMARVFAQATQDSSSAMSTRDADQKKNAD